MLTECEDSWGKHGYKKTSVDDLCKKVGISKGAFYLFFESKESLFLDVMRIVQRRLYDLAEDILISEQSKYGVSKVLTTIYDEYSQKSFLYDSSSHDFTSFINRITEKEREEISSKNYHNSKHMITKPFLKLKVSEEMALSALSSLLSTIGNKGNTLLEHKEVFSFITSCIVENLFE